MESEIVAVFFLVPEVSAYGDATTARELARALPIDQFSKTIGVLGKCDRRAILAEELTSAGVAVKSVPIRHALDFSGVRQLRQAIRESKPHVIHAWGPSAARAVRSVVRRAGDSLNDPRLIISDATNTGGGLTGWLTARQVRRADRVVPRTRADGDRYRRLGVPAEQLTLISPSAPEPCQKLNREAFCRELDIPPGSRLIVTGGRSESGKGPRDAIVAFDMMRYDSKDLYLIVVGGAADTAALEQFARSLAFDDLRIRFPPVGHGRSAAVHHAEAVIATCPRTAVEEALEAMAAGKPVVGWETTDLGEIVEDKVTGVLVPAGDRGALAACTRSSR